MESPVTLTLGGDFTHSMYASIVQPPHSRDIDSALAWTSMHLAPSS